MTATRPVTTTAATIAAGTFPAKPILFSAPMIQAILNGKKVQTRRIVKPQPESPAAIYDVPGADTQLTPRLMECEDGLRLNWWWALTKVGNSPCVMQDYEKTWTKSPHGRVGTHLWVRETFFATEYPNKPLLPNAIQTPNGWAHVSYRADSDKWMRDNSGAWKPSVHMPQWASRITLEITRVRVERLKDISEEDAIAEGCKAQIYTAPSAFIQCYISARDDFASLWESIHGVGTWERNDWVWVYDFKRI
jgi:hypothetical protein